MKIEVKPVLWEGRPMVEIWVNGKYDRRANMFEVEFGGRAR